MGDLSWDKTFPAAIRHAARKKPIFVDFYAEWCGPCKMLERDGFSDPRVQALLRKTVCLRIDIDQDKTDASKFKVNSIPRLFLLSADGKRVIWDATGYRDADTLVQELEDALSVKNATPVALEPPALDTVRSALGAGSYSSLRAKDPKTAAEGLRLLVLDLGTSDRAVFKADAELIQKAGRLAVGPLIEGMGSKALAVRAGAYKVLKEVVPQSERGTLDFDPWAPASKRVSHLSIWKHWLASHLTG